MEISRIVIMLTFLSLKSDLYLLAGVAANTSRTDIIEAARLAILKAQQRFIQSGDWSFLEQYQDTVYIPLKPPTTTGTVTVTIDSKTVTGVGTTFTADMVGDYFRLTDNEFYEIRFFNSATSIELSIPYQSATAATQTFQILKRFYPLPLDFDRGVTEDARICTPGTNEEVTIDYDHEASFWDIMDTGKPQWYAYEGNSKNADYYNTGTVTIATAAGLSTWTVSSGTLPSDSVDRYVRVVGEDRPYRVKTRLGATTFTTYETYVNPANQTGTLAVATVWAMTPKTTSLIAFSRVPDQRYIFKMPYVKKPLELLLDTDVSLVSTMGYDRALLALARAEMAKDGRVAIRGDLIAPLMADAEAALADAWGSEIYDQTLRDQARGARHKRDQVGPSWLWR